MEDIESQLEDEFFSSILNLDNVASGGEFSPPITLPLQQQTNLNAQIQQQQQQLQQLKQQKEQLQTQIQHMNIIQHQQPFPTFANSTNTTFFQAQQQPPQQLVQQQPFLQEAAQQFASIGNNVFNKPGGIKQDEYTAAVHQYAQETAFNNSFFPAVQQQQQQPQPTQRPYNNSPMQVTSYSNSPHSPYWDGTTVSANTSPAPMVAPVHQQASLPFVGNQQGFFAPQPQAAPMYQPLPAFTQPAIQQNNHVLRLSEGYNRQLEAHEKPIGGKDNVKHCLARQVVELNATTVPKNIPISTLCVKAFVCGYHKPSKSSTSATKVVLAEVGEKKFEEKKDENVLRFMAAFENIICKFSSHNNGQKLFLRFVLCDGSKTRICFIDSEEFETITKRGIDKQKKRKRSDSDSAATVEDVDPACGFTTGGQLVKVTGFGFLCPPLSHATVLFGVKESPEIHSMKRNVIICETPAAEKPCSVDVTVSFDKKSYLQSNAKYRYVDPNDEQGMKEMLKYLMKSNNNTPIDHGSKMAPDSPDNQTSIISNATSQNMPPMASWLKGIESDYRGYTLLHFSCAYGFVELSHLLVASNYFDLDVQDNYGKSAIYWACWSNNSFLVQDLIHHGASIDMQDDMGENLFHIMAHDNLAAMAKDVLFGLLHRDDAIKTNATLIKTLLEQPNKQDQTPMDIAKQQRYDDDEDEDNGDYLCAIFNAVHKICVKQSVIPDLTLSSVIFRNAPMIGKNLFDVLPSITECSLKLDKDMFVLCLFGGLQREKQFFVQLEHRNLAFLILDSQKQTVEWTLRQTPEIVTSATMAETQPLRTMLSFQTQVANLPALEMIRLVASQSTHLQELSTNCYSFVELAKKMQQQQPTTSTAQQQPVTLHTKKQQLQKSMFEKRMKQLGAIKNASTSSLLTTVNKSLV